ncbi:MAG: site-specific integrase [Candidatus Heimdallarchaeota archaeon]|nr:site-specific integrase [Candidatus Heimdallarchaeota archaeon]
MTLNEALTLFKNHQRSNMKKRTRESYKHLINNFEASFGGRSFESITSEEIYNFLETLTESLSKSTRRLRYAQMKAFYNLIIENCALNIKNPCNAPILTKTFKMPKKSEKRILDKEIVDEIIYNTKRLRDRLLLELQARCGLRVGETLRLKVSDISERKLILRDPKSGKDEEVAFMPEQISNRLNDYIKRQNLTLDDRVFPICYSTARALIKKFGEKLGLNISPHDLRRHSATYASRQGVPLEVISKVILRHQDLKTTQMYLGKVSDSEAIRWMDVLYER